MSATNFDECLRRLLAHEGGYTNDPSDPGGPTNFGITIADYRRYVKPRATPADVRAMDVRAAKAIYRTHYWDAMRCDELPGGLDDAVFDYGVNSGVGRAVKVLQRLLGLADDGRVTDALLAAARSRDAPDLITRLCDERLAFLKSLKTWPVFGAGWQRRVADVRAAALAMAAASLAAAPSRRPAAAGAKVPETQPAPERRSSGARIAGAIGAASAVLAQQAHRLGVRPGVIVVAAIIVIAAAAAGWILWRSWQRRDATT